MTWIIIAYLIALVFLSCNSGRLKSTANLKPAWGWFACIFFIKAIAEAISNGLDRSKELALLESWSTVAIWLVLGISVAQLPSLFVGSEDSSSEP